MRGIGAAAVLAGLVLLTAGCGEEPTGGPTAADYQAERQRLLAQMKKNQGKASAPAPVQPAPEAEAPVSGFGQVAASYSYDPRGKRDPFQSFSHESGPTLPAMATPLMNFELGQLSVVAVIWDTRRPRAIVSDPRGETYVVKEGSPIGKNDGLVIHIGDNMVLVKETYVDFAGEMTTKDVELRVRRSQGG